MSYGDVLVVGLSGVLFVAAAFAVRRGLRSGRPAPARPTEPVRVREEELAWPVLGPDGRPAWATQDELPWHDIVHPPPPPKPAAARRAPDRNQRAAG